MGFPPLTTETQIHIDVVVDNILIYSLVEENRFPTVTCDAKVSTKISHLHKHRYNRRLVTNKHADTNQVHVIAARLQQLELLLTM